jgi:RHS repeat-associated protein
VLPDSSSKEFEYDPAGRVKLVTLNSGKKQTTIYKFSGVVDKIEYRNAGNTLTGTDDFTYDSLLRRTGATSRYGVTSGWTYDDLGRMLTESTTYSSQTYNVGYHYDSRGRLDEITYPSGRKAEYTFDERSAIDTIEWDSIEIEDRDYDDLGRLASIDRPGIDETRGYDDAGRLTSIGNTNVGTATYTYDANHNKLSEAWSGAMADWSFVTTNGGTYSSGYDAEDRFRNFVQSAKSVSLYLDRSDIGNITNYQMNSVDSYRSYSNIHALTSVGGTSQTFNSDGQLTSSYHGHTNSWDEAGMLKQANVTGSVGIVGENNYGYDATQRRIFKNIVREIAKDTYGTVEHIVYIHAGPNLIAEYTAGTAAASPSQEYVYAQEIDSLVLLVRNGGSDKYTITRNQQWSVTALADLSSGSVVERYTYDAFGKRTILAADGSTVRTTSSYNMPFGYTSRQHDPETGLMYFRARYYDPSTGEFTSPDPLEYVDGMSLYRGYMGLRGLDPNGTVEVCCGFCNGKEIWSATLTHTSGNDPCAACNKKANGIIWDWKVVDCRFGRCSHDGPCGGKLSKEGEMAYELCMTLCREIPIKTPSIFGPSCDRYVGIVKYLCEQATGYLEDNTLPDPKEWACDKVCCAGKLPNGIPGDECFSEIFNKNGERLTDDDAYKPCAACCNKLEGEIVKDSCRKRCTIWSNIPLR